MATEYTIRVIDEGGNQLAEVQGDSRLLSMMLATPIVDDGGDMRDAPHSLVMATQDGGGLFFEVRVP